MKQVELYELTLLWKRNCFIGNDQALGSNLKRCCWISPCLHLELGLIGQEENVIVTCNGRKGLQSSILNYTWTKKQGIGQDLFPSTSMTHTHTHTHTHLLCLYLSLSRYLNFFSRFSAAGKKFLHYFWKAVSLWCRFLLSKRWSKCDTKNFSIPLLK